jgi:hypothetical protein
VAVIVAETVAVAVLVEMVKVAVVAPVGIEIDAGTRAEELLLESVTVRPPDGALPVKVTVPVEEEPPETVEGLTEIDAKATLTVGVIVKAAVLVRPA